MIVNRRRETQLKSGLFERVIDDTNFIEKIVFILWFGLPYILYLMLESFDLIIRLGLTLGIFTLASLIVYWFGTYMGSGDRYWN